jgi:hypothetical protein
LVAVLDRAYEVGAVSRPLPVEITEFGVLSLPKDIGVSPATQVASMAASEYLAWRDPGVASFGQYLIRDDSPQNALTFTTGLRYADDSAKPLRRAFAMTLLVRRAGHGYVSVWGHVRPARSRATVAIDTRTRDGEPERLRVVSTDADGYFHFDSGFQPGLRWRATATLAGGRRLRGPFVRALRFPAPAP